MKKIIIVYLLILLVGCQKPNFNDDFNYENVGESNVIVFHNQTSTGIVRKIIHNYTQPENLTGYDCFCILQGISQGEEIYAIVPINNSECIFAFADIFPKGESIEPYEDDYVISTYHCESIVG